MYIYDFFDYEEFPLKYFDIKESWSYRSLYIYALSFIYIYTSSGKQQRRREQRLNNAQKRDLLRYFLTMIVIPSDYMYIYELERILIRFRVSSPSFLLYIYTWCRNAPHEYYMYYKSLRELMAVLWISTLHTQCWIVVGAGKSNGFRFGIFFFAPSDCTAGNIGARARADAVVH